MLSTISATTPKTTTFNQQQSDVTTNSNNRNSWFRLIHFIYEHIYGCIIRFYKSYILFITAILSATVVQVAATTTVTKHSNASNKPSVLQPAQSQQHQDVVTEKDELALKHQQHQQLSLPKINDDKNNESLHLPSSSYHKNNHDADLTTTEWEEDDATSISINNDDHDGDDANSDTCTEVVVTSQEKSVTTPPPPIVQQLLQINDFKRHVMLGEGQFGQVWLVTKKNETTLTNAPSSPPTPYALKVLSKYDLICNDEVDMMIREKEIMLTISSLHNQQLQQHHPCIVQLYASFHDEYFVYLLQEFCQGGELFTLMHNNNKNNTVLRDIPNNTINEQNIAFYILGITSALEYLHVQHHIVYRDLKPENIMIDAQTGYPKMIDFGYAKQLVSNSDDDDIDHQYKTYTFCGTPNYVAPEMIFGDDDGCSFPVDYWALGIILHEMIFPDSHPFIPVDTVTNKSMTCIDQHQLFDSICNDEYMAPSTDYSGGVSDHAINLIQQLLNKDPKQRLGRTPLNTRGNDTATSNTSVGNHPFFKTYNMDINDIYPTQRMVAPYIPTVQNAYDTSSFGTIDDNSTPTNITKTTTKDKLLQKYPKLNKREAAMFDGF